MTLEEWAHNAYVALKALPCRCQMKGGARWHLAATPEVAIQCSRCKCIEEYEAHMTDG